MGCARWRRRGEYKRGDIHQDDRCSAEIDGETKPPRCRDGAQHESERAHRQITKEIKRRENTAAVIRGCRRANHLQTADKQQAVRPSRGGGRQQVDYQIPQVDRQNEQDHA